MKDQVQVLSAGTTYPNTPESDLQRTVLHTVKLSDGTTMNLEAIDPPDAIRKAENILAMRRKYD